MKSIPLIVGILATIVVIILLASSLGIIDIRL